MVCHYEMDEQGLETLGAHIIAGRDFRKEEIMPPMTPENMRSPRFPGIIVTQALAQTLFPDGNAVGKAVYDPSGTTRQPSSVSSTICRARGPRMSHTSSVFLRTRNCP